MTRTIAKSQYFMARSFKKTRYAWETKPKMELINNYGMYVNVPFCQSFCSFCPFYKVKSRPELLEAYVDTIKKEIKNQDLPAPPQWIYIGGGTPNILSIEQLKQIVDSIKEKVGFPEAGIELMPGRLDEKYVNDIADLGFKKISLGVESLDVEVNKAVHRQAVTGNKVYEVLQWAKSRGLFVNIDLITGLQKQNPESFISDLIELLKWGPSQVTIYPYMVVRGFNVKPGFQSEEQFKLIEQAWAIMKKEGFKRLSPWTFASQAGEYDCSKAELVNDYIGFGAGSFSTNKEWKIVNPPVEYYLREGAHKNSKALIARKESAADQWRMFGKMLSDLKLSTRPDLSMGINAYVLWLKAAGYVKKGLLTKKGMLLAHHLMKTIVESLPFPLLDHNQISNPEEFLSETKSDVVSKVEYVAETA